MPELDTYEEAGLDEDVSDLNADAQYAARAAAEAELDRRDNRSRRRGLPTALDGASKPAWPANPCFLTFLNLLLGGDDAATLTPHTPPFSFIAEDDDDENEERAFRRRRRTSFGVAPSEDQQVLGVE